MSIIRGRCLYVHYTEHAEHLGLTDTMSSIKKDRVHKEHCSEGSHMPYDSMVQLCQKNMDRSVVTETQKGQRENLLKLH